LLTIQRPRKLNFNLDATATENVRVAGLLPKRLKRHPPRLPEGVRIYAIGDVHGRVDLLDQVFSRIDAHLAAYPIAHPLQVLVGDYIDRGPASREVLDRLIYRARTRQTVFLRGNHETFIFEFLRRPAVLGDWGRLGGLETLLSYGLKPSFNPDAATQKELAIALRAALPMSHRIFLESLHMSFNCGEFFFAHAGVRPGVPLAKQREEDLLWIREEFLLHEEDFGKIIVHGHTPVREVDIRRNRINIDTGAYATGRLTCLVIQGETFEPL
jgi:serine/threonine protein phosphatase 1